MKRCLVVDDSDVIRKVARRILESNHFEVTEAANGQEALERCKAEMPDLVMIDWHMPVMGAFEFLSGLRLMHRAQRPVVVYCTTENDATDINRAFSAGADDYLLKPYDRSTIEGKLAELKTLLQ